MGLPETQGGTESGSPDWRRLCIWPGVYYGRSQLLCFEHINVIVPFQYSILMASVSHVVIYILSYFSLSVPLSPKLVSCSDLLPWFTVTCRILCLT